MPYTQIYICFVQLPLSVTLKKIYDRNDVNKYKIYLLLRHGKSYSYSLDSCRRPREYVDIKHTWLFRFLFPQSEMMVLMLLNLYLLDRIQFCCSRNSIQSNTISKNIHRNLETSCQYKHYITTFTTLYFNGSDLTVGCLPTHAIITKSMLQ